MGAFRASLLGIALVLPMALLPAATARIQEHASSNRPRDIVLVSEEWNDYTEADGSGLGWDLMRRIFEPAGVNVRASTTPYMRAIGLVRRGAADGWVGAYSNEVPDTLYPKRPFDKDEIYALGLADTLPPTLASLGYFRVAWMRGYQFQRYLPHITEFNEVWRRDSILSMLEFQRADLYIDAKPEIDQLLRQTRDPRRFTATYLADLPLYVSFADTERGRALRDLYDRRLAELVRSGELEPLFQRWRQPYPFDTPEGYGVGK